MAMRSFTPTITFSKSFLAKAWDARKDMLENEKRGFAQFFYLTLCGHVESQLASVITQRLIFISRAIRWEDAPPMTHEEQGTVQVCPNEPLAASIRQMSRKLEEEVESAPLSKLLEHFDRVFPENLRYILGPELLLDIDSLAALRNIFAHGRNLTMDFEGEDWITIKGTLDGNPIKKPALRLLHAGIIKDFDINANNYHDFYLKFYSDDAMLYFYEAAQSIETKLASFTPFLPEKRRDVQTTLPPLCL